MDKMRFALHLVFICILTVMVGGYATAGQDKVEVCHITGTYEFPDGAGPAPVGHVISNADPAYPKHVAHGDTPYWRYELKDDGTEVCVPVLCPCYSLDKLQNYYESIVIEFAGWYTEAHDERNCGEFENVYAFAFGTPGPFKFLIMMGNTSDGWMCEYRTLHKQYEMLTILPIDNKEREACVGTLLDSQLFQNAGTIYTCP